MSTEDKATTDRQLIKQLGRVGLELLGRFPELRPSQRAAIPPVFSGQGVLLACATASGKTEAVLAPLIARIVAADAKRNSPALLAIAPTRALVNDLYRRLQPPLERLGLTCSRQSSDHRATLTNAFVLVTTPESLDSLLARRAVFSREGRPIGHELSSVQALFIDEVHLFDNTPRGDQLQWLIARLRRVTSLAKQPRQLQVCAASATVSNPKSLAERILGESVKVVTVEGSRNLRLFSAGSPPSWEEATSSWDISRFRRSVNLLSGKQTCSGVCNILWKVLSTRTERDAPRKLLVFTATRALCDSLSFEVKTFLQKRRQLSVLAHHGSLSKEMREKAEQQFNSSRDGVLVATTTLEVGVDIGDVDAVVLVGPASDVSGLLQRIGRSGRREGVTRVVACARDTLEQTAMASMLMSAAVGQSDVRNQSRNWSIVVQQTASFTRQSGSQGRKRSDVLQLAYDTWGEQGKRNTSAIIDHLLDQGLISKSRDDRLTLDGDWVRAWEGMGMHGNIGSGTSMVPLVDSMTGMTIAEIPLSNVGHGVLNLGGRQWQTEFINGELVAKSSSMGSSGSNGVRYGGRRAPVTQAFGRHVAVGCGLAPTDVVQLATSKGLIVFHFGGSVFEQALLSMPMFRHANALIRGICIVLRAGIELDFRTTREEKPTSVSPLRIDEGAWRTLLPPRLPSEELEAEEAMERFLEWWRRRSWTSSLTSTQEKLLLEIVELGA